MYCNHCGAAIPDDSVYCPECGHVVVHPPYAGAPANGAVLPPAAGRVTRHRHILGALWLIWALMILAAGLMVLSLWRLHGMGPEVMPGPVFMEPFMSGIGVGLVVMGVLAIIAGVGLLIPLSWARMLALVLGIIELVSIPFGTALGIYTLWVLMPHESEREYARLVRAAAQPRT